MTLSELSKPFHVPSCVSTVQIMEFCSRIEMRPVHKRTFMRRWRKLTGQIPSTRPVNNVSGEANRPRLVVKRSNDPRVDSDKPALNSRDFCFCYVGYWTRTTGCCHGGSGPRSARGAYMPCGIRCGHDSGTVPSRVKCS